MANRLIAYRYFAFAVFLICSAIICCTSVWNLSLSGISNEHRQVDVLLIFASTLGLLYTLSIICVDLAYQNAAVCRIWIECMCIGLFWLFHFSGAAALSAILPGMTCAGSDHMTCVSTEVMLGFAWLSSFNLMIYLGVLVIMTCIQQQIDGQVWQACVRHYDWSAPRKPLGSGSSSPILQKKPFLLSVPPPVPAQTEFSRRMVRDLEKQDPSAANAPQPKLHVLVQNNTARPARPTLIVPQTLVSASQVQPPLPVSRTPQLLRNIADPGTASPSTYSATTRPDSPQSSTGGQVSPQSSSPTASSPSRHSRSRRSPTARRPPPLDLSKITAYR